MLFRSSILVICGGLLANAMEPCLESYQLFASQSIEFADRSNIQARAYAPRIVLGNDSRYTGVLIAPQFLQVKDRAQIHGGLYWNESFLQGNQVTLDFPPEQTAQSANCATPTFEIQPGTNNLEFMPGDDGELVPGAYGDLMVRAGASLELAPGEYSFRSVMIEPDALLSWSNDSHTRIVLKVSGNVSLGDRSMARGDGKLEILGNGDMRIGTDTWTNIQGQFPSGTIYVASRAQLNARLLGRHIRFEPDVGAFGIPSFRYNALFDRKWLSGNDTLGMDELLQFAFRTDNPESFGEGYANMHDRLSLLNEYRAESDSSQWLPLVTVFRQFAIQSPNQRLPQSMGITVFADNTLSADKSITLLAPLEFAVVDNDAPESWTIEVQNNTYHLLPDSSVVIQPLDPGIHTARIECTLRSGSQFHNYFRFETVPADSLAP